MNIKRNHLSNSKVTIGEQAVDSCPICGENSFVRFALGQDYEIETCNNDWRLVQCSDCECVWLNPRPKISDLSIIYPEHYYAYDFEKRINRMAAFGKYQLDRRKFKSIFKLLAIRPESYLDIGCGTGRYLKCASELGLQKEKIFGIDISDKPLKELRDQGFQTECSRAENYNIELENKFDLITMFHVIEHLENPKETIELIEKWLNPGGLLVIETPNIDSLDAKIFRQSYWGGYHFPRHWTLFSERSVQKLFSNGQLQLQAIKYKTGHSFWLYSLHHVFKYKWKFTRKIKLHNFVHPHRGIMPLLAVTFFDLTRAFFGFKTSAMMVIARKKA